MIYPKENIVYTGILKKTDEISITFRLMRDSISFDKIQPKQLGYLGTRIN
jgi:hypothetical protein